MTSAYDLFETTREAVDKFMAEDKRMTNQYDIPGGMLCTVCGLRYYSKSMGGPGICPACDCGNTGPVLVKAQKDEIERLREVLTIPNITPETTSSAMFIRTLSEHEKGLPVNGQDLINALMWRVKNQRKEIARLQAKRDAAEPPVQPICDCSVNWKGCQAQAGRTCSVGHYHRDYTPAAKSTAFVCPIHGPQQQLTDAGDCVLCASARTNSCALLLEDK